MKGMKNPALVLAALLALFLFAAPALAYDTENVIIVVIDGIRNQEAFENPQYIPHIWNDLRPQGTIYTEFYNDFQTTYTTPGHDALLTGVWHFLPNVIHKTNVECEVRPEAPTIFEYYRKHFGYPEASCLFVTGKYNNVYDDWSLEPSYGPDYKCFLFLGGTDDQTYALFADKFAEYQPRLVMINFQDVDKIAHTGDWNGYLNAIRHVDELIYQIWTDLVQANPLYVNKTTLIVTSDHGRNDDTIGFQHHGGMTESNRHIPFLAIGPDTPAGVEVSERRYQIDLAPTVGELLGFPTDYAQGQVMTGMIDPALNPDDRIRVFRNNPRAASYNDGVYVVWAQNEETDMGNSRVYFMKKDPGGQTFDAPMMVTDPPEARWAFYPAVAANKNGVHVVWLDSRPLLEGDTWSIFYRKSPDWGETWEPEKIIATSTFGGAFGGLQIVGEPEIIASDSGELVVSVRYRSPYYESTDVTSFRSGNGGKTWGEIKIKGDSVFPKQYSPAVLSKSYEAGLTWIDMGQKPGQFGQYGWEIYFMRTMDGGGKWKNYQRLSYDDDHSMIPKLAYGGGRLVVVWGSRDATGTPWQLEARASSNKGRSWGWTQVLPIGTSAWQPSIVWNPAKGKFVMVWTDYASTLPDIQMSTSSNGTSWAQPQDVAPNPGGGLRWNPQAVYADGKVYVIWQEYDPASGDWVIETAAVN